MDFFRLVLAILPFLFFCLLLFCHLASLLKISLITLLITVIITVIFWQSSLSVVVFSLTRGFLIAFDILLIILGAILFLEILKKIKVTDSLAGHLDNFSPDLRVQVIVLAWFLENFLEGIAGFGTPSTVVAPLLIALGLSPLNSVIISLLGNSTSVPFGAVGTPIRVGFTGINLNLVSIASSAAFYNFVGILVPSFMLWVLVLSKPNRFNLFCQALPFALWSGIAFVLPAYLISFLGFEFPSIIGSILGLVLVIITSHFGFLVPHPVYRQPLPAVAKTIKLLTLKQTIFPYAIFIFLLVLAKIFLSNWAIPLPKLSYSINLFNPGFVFIITAVIVAIYFKINRKSFGLMTKLAINKSVEPFLIIGAISAVVQLMNNSTNIVRQLPSITRTISLLFNTQFLPILAPFIGAFGSFITGSATVSNLMFASPVYYSSLFLNLDSVKILSLLVVGSGAGNMIALADVLVAKTVAEVGGSIRDIILMILPYCLIYLVLIALFGLLI